MTVQNNLPMTEEKKKRGRPVGTSLYKNAYPAELIKLMEEGSLNCHIYAKWNICKDTFYRWLHEYPELKQAYEVGLPKCESWWIEWGMKGMRGEVRNFNTTAWIMFMNNKFGWSKNNSNGDVQGSTTTNISIQNMNVLNQQNRQQLLESVRSLALKHEDIIDIKVVEDDADQSK